MKLSVRNFGPIREATNIDISQMTIFVGPSNTGKSYLAMLIYSIFNVFADEEYVWDLYRQFGKVSGTYSEGSNNSRQDQIISSTEIKTRFSEWARFTSDVWKHKVVYCFGEEGKNVIEGKNGNEDCSVRISAPENQFILDLTTPQNSKISLKKSEELSEHITHQMQLLLSDELKEHYADDQTSSLKDDLYQHLMQRYYPGAILQHFEITLLPWKPLESFIDAYYLPAIRGGIMQSHRTLVSALIERAPMAGLSDSPDIPLFNGVLSDFMKKLINISDGGFKRESLMGRLGARLLGYKQRGDFSDKRKKMEKISSRIEQGILSGEIYIQRSEAQYPDFRYKFTKDNKEYDLPLMSASSSVSELAPVSLFLHHYVSPGDLFIVEEPEAHLHPAAQRKISDVLARLVNAGVRVLITTHSDNILEQVGNFIYAAELPDSKLTKLEEDKCSVYLFKRGSRGNKTTVKKVPFDPETGLVTQDHLNVSSELYNETVNLMEQRENVGSQTDI